MPTIAVTAATGQLGRLVVDALLERGVDPASIVAAVRTPDNAQDLAARGVQVREADYTKPDTLKAAFQGVDRVLLISSSEVGQRAAQHANAIAAAEDAGVELLAYTSVLQADTTTMLLAAEHQETERRLAQATVPVALLRNGWYTENYTGQLEVTLEHGVVGSAGEGRVAPAPRRDFAEAAAAVLTGEGHAGRTYELAGDEALTLTEIAALIGEATGKDVGYTDLPVEAYTEVLSKAGLPAPVDGVIADSSAAIGRGELTTDSGDLARLIGRPTTPVADAIRADVGAAAA
ncbi:SDR family oxidoreductase [Patulibacter sp.]|uniref:SDR family oxidoreductase n=1 Tax=Patulibacter sp. TaxID=1912859 RepID=UPI002718E2AC|nr:SDR family oxidoreductase [Patulibacter sp.]MDO9409165.1 SDR family oxidoreductase [Patulibacter sp.]